jgi:hypothetical protein
VRNFCLDEKRTGWVLAASASWIVIVLHALAFSVVLARAGRC